MMDFGSVLQGLLNPNNQIRAEAEAYLNAQLNQDYDNTILLLCGEFVNESNPEQCRQVVGIFMKNIITAQDEVILQGKREKWLNCNPSVKAHVKQGLLQALCSNSKFVGRAAAQAVGAFGAVEAMGQSWPELVPSLRATVVNPQGSVESKISALDAIGFLCELLPQDSLMSSDVNIILTILVENMRSDVNQGLHLAAVGALLNSLDFTSPNFEVDSERDAIMNAMISSTQSNVTEIRAKSYECLTKVAENFYNKITPYLQPLFNISVNAIRNDEPEVASQSMEFWYTIASDEIDILEDIADGIENVPFFRVVEQVAPSLLPVVLEAISKQSDEDCDDNNNVVDSAMALIDAMAIVLKESIVGLTFPFIKNNVTSDNWNLRNAAILVLGCIIGGPPIQTTGPIIVQAAPTLIGQLSHPILAVRSSSVWTIGRFLELYSTEWPSDTVLSLINAVASSLDDHSKVANGACLAIHNIAEQCEDIGQNSNILSTYMGQLLHKLFGLTNRADHMENNLRSSAYEAINVLVGHSAPDTTDIIVQVLQEALSRLEGGLSTLNNGDDGLSQICGTLSECLRKLEFIRFEPLITRILNVILTILNTKAHNAIHEEALVSLGYVADKMGDSFQTCGHLVIPPVIEALKKTDDYQLCIIALGAMGDIARAMGTNIFKFCDEIIQQIIEILRSTTVVRVVKPHAISAFGDIALAIGPGYERYLEITLSILDQASQVTPASVDDEDEIEYVNNLREAILQTYTALIQGMKDAGHLDAIGGHFMHIGNFLVQTAADNNKSDDVLHNAIGLVGDIAENFKKKSVTLCQNAAILAMIQEGMSSAHEKNRELAHWTNNWVNAVLR